MSVPSLKGRIIILVVDYTYTEDVLLRVCMRACECVSVNACMSMSVIRSQLIRINSKVTETL